MISQLSMRSVSLCIRFFCWLILGNGYPASDENCLHCVFNVFLGTRYAMVSQPSMRSVSILYSNVLLVHVRQWIPSFQRKLTFGGFTFSLALVSQRIDSFRLSLFALRIQCFPWHSLCYD